jgi:multiple sugar transport system substrate-binding protein
MHRKWARSARALALLAVFGLILAACTGDDEPEGEATGETTETTTGTTGGATGEQEQVTIEMWTWGSVDDTLAILADQFMADNPGVEIVITEQAFDSYFGLVRNALASKTGPDVFQMFANSGIFDFHLGLVPLTDYVTPEQQEELLGWENVSAGRSIDGAPYGVPYLSQGYPWYYNKALFEQAGLDPENPPTNWNDFLAACDALNAAGITPIINGFGDGYGVEQFMDVFFIQMLPEEEVEAYLQNPDGIDWTRPELAQALTYTQDLLEHGCTDPNAAGFPMWPNSLNRFAAGQGAIFQGLMSDVANWADFQEDLGDDLGVWLGPLLPDAVYDQPPLDYSPNLAWAINGVSENPDIAFEWISLVASQQGQEQAWETNGSMPNNTLAQVSSDYAPAQTILGWIEDPAVVKVSGPVPFMRPAVDSTFATTVSGIYTGALTIEELFTQVQTVDSALPPIPEA